MTHALKIISFITLFVLSIAVYPAPSLTQTPATPAPAIQPATPKIESIVNLGIPAGNGTMPQHLALNSQAGQVYILSNGIPALKQGNGLSVYDIQSGQITGHAKINRGDNQTLDLQFDSQTGLLYALWQEQFADTPPTLSVIDPGSLQVMEDVPGVEVIAAGGGQLYVANTQHLAILSPPNYGSLEGRRIDLPAAAPGPMAVSPATNRLYLARNAEGTWSLEIFEADTLAPVGNVPFETTILDILPRPNADEVFVIAARDDLRVLSRLTSDGEPADDLPYELGPRFGVAGIALSPDGERLYFSNGQPRSTRPDSADTTGPALVSLSSSDLSPLVNIPLLTNFDDLVIHNPSNQAFALYPFENFLYVIDLEAETAQIVNTAIELRDVLVDEESSQIFVSDSANRIRRLDGNTLAVRAETRLQGNGADYGFNTASWSGELALDRERNHLYVSGLPATVLEADTLAEIATLEPGGQLAPDPSGDNIYVSNCGLTILDAPTLSTEALVPGSGPRADGLSPNPCVGYSRLDAANQLLYSLVPNGVPGSNGGSYLYVYDLSLEPTLVFTDTDISFVSAEPDPANRRAFVGYVRHGNKRLRTLAVPTSGPIQYTRQLLGVWGNSRYSATTNRLYLSDRNLNRLLMLEADTLSVIDALPLPPDYDYRLAGLDPTSDRLYLIGLDGQLLIASPDAVQSQYKPIPSPTRAPTGKILAVKSTDSDHVLARIETEYENYFDTRLYRSANRGQTWTDLSRHLPPLPVQALAASADGQTLLAGLLRRGETGGLYKSTDGGQSWRVAMNGLQDLWLESLFIAPHFEQTGLIFAHTTHAGLHQSTDGGQSWDPLAQPDPNALFPSPGQKAAVAFSREGTVLVSQSLAESRGIFRATLQPDGALSAWQPVLDIPMTQLALSPNEQLALAFGRSLWRSIDGGLTWQIGGAGLSNLDDLQASNLFFSPDFTQDNVAYLFFTSISGDTPARLFRTTDAGQSWQPWLKPLQNGNFTAITPASNGDLILGDTQAQLTQISPAAMNWASPTTPTAPFPIDDLAVSPNFTVDQTLFAISSQHGLYKSMDGGQSWQHTEFPARSFGFSARGYQVALSPAFAQDQTMFAATGLSLHRSTDGGQHWQQLELADNQALSFQAQQVALSPNFAGDTTLLVITSAAVYRSTDGGDTWQQVLTADGEASTTDLLTFAPDGKTAYARFGYSQSLFTSTDGGQTWQPQPADTDNLFSIIAAATAPDGSLLAALEYENRLLQTDPQTQLWRTVSESLPAGLTGVQAVAYGPNNTLYVGGQGGIFRTTDKGQSWQMISADSSSSANVTALYTVDTNLFAILATGEIITSANGGDSWMDISVVQ